MLIGLACALVLGALFYGAMAYQLAGEETGSMQRMQQAEGALALPGAALLGEQSAVQRWGETEYAVHVREYETAGGVPVQLISAQGAGYMERLSAQGYTSQLITGFTLAGMDAVYALKDGAPAVLCARRGDAVYMLLAQADEQTMYALGAAAVLE